MDRSVRAVANGPRLYDKGTLSIEVLEAVSRRFEQRGDPQYERLLGDATARSSVPRQPVKAVWAAMDPVLGQPPEKNC